jgi:Fe-S oxidoreductase
MLTANRMFSIKSDVRPTSRQAELLATGIAVVGIEPVTTLMQDSEYKLFRQESAVSSLIVSLEDFLLDEVKTGRISRGSRAPRSSTYSLFLHCTENAAKPAAAARWAKVFGFLGASAQSVQTRCCGMAGMFGHEVEHLEMSKKLFAMRWEDKLAKLGDSIPVMTGPDAILGDLCRYRADSRRQARSRTL